MLESYSARKSYTTSLNAKKKLFSGGNFVLKAVLLLVACALTLSMFPSGAEARTLPPVKKTKKVNKPDLIVSKTMYPRSPYTQLASVNLRAEVKNQGRATTRSATTTAFILSKDRKIDKKDTRLKVGKVKKGIQPSKKTITSSKVRIPAKVTPGRYWLFACVDQPRNRVSELNERNNCRAQKSRVLIRIADRCKNIPGYQGRVPAPLKRNASGNCVIPPVDVCRNIPGNQPVIPEGMFRGAGGECITDACPNITGNQLAVPRGLVKSGNDCVAPAFPTLDNMTLSLAKAVGNEVRPLFVFRQVSMGTSVEVFSILTSEYEKFKWDEKVACEQPQMTKIMNRDPYTIINDFTSEGLYATADVPLTVYGQPHKMFYRAAYEGFESPCKEMPAPDGFSDYMLDVIQPKAPSGGYLLKWFVDKDNNKMDGSNTALQNTMQEFMAAEIADPTRTGTVTVRIHVDLYGTPCHTDPAPDPAPSGYVQEPAPTEVKMTAPQPGHPISVNIPMAGLTGKQVEEFVTENPSAKYYVQTTDAAGNKSSCNSIEVKEGVPLP